MTEEELCIVLKNRLNTLIDHHNNILNALKTTNTEHPDYLKQPVDVGTIVEKLGVIPSNVKALETYTKTATDIYLKSMNQYEILKDSHIDYVTEKHFLF